MSRRPGPPGTAPSGRNFGTAAERCCSHFEEWLAGGLSPRDVAVERVRTHGRNRANRIQGGNGNAEHERNYAARRIGLGPWRPLCLDRERRRRGGPGIAHLLD